MSDDAAADEITRLRARVEELEGLPEEVIDQCAMELEDHYHDDAANILRSQKKRLARRALRGETDG